MCGRNAAMTTSAAPAPALTTARSGLAGLRIWLPRLALALGIMAAPILFLPSMQDTSPAFVGLKDKKSNGVGFVLLVSLRR